MQSKFATTSAVIQSDFGLCSTEVAYCQCKHVLKYAVYILKSRDMEVEEYSSNDEPIKAAIQPVEPAANLSP